MLNSWWCPSVSIRADIAWHHSWCLHDIIEDLSIYAQVMMSFILILCYKCLGTPERSKDFVSRTGFPADRLFLDPGDHVDASCLGLARASAALFRYVWQLFGYCPCIRQHHVWRVTFETQCSGEILPLLPSIQVEPSIPPFQFGHVATQNFPPIFRTHFST